MKTLNFTKKFVAGQYLITHKEYKSAHATISVGDEGKIFKNQKESFPSMGLFDLNILYMDFNGTTIVMAEQVAINYFKLK